MKTYSACCVAVLLLVAAALSSCNKKNTEGRHIPKDALLVIEMNRAELLSKLPAGFTQDDPLSGNDSLVGQLFDDSTLPATIKKFYKNPESAGADMKADMTVSFVNDTTGSYLAIEGKIKDAALFSAYGRELIKNGTESVSSDSTHFISHSSMGLGWNKEQFIYVIDLNTLKNKFYGSNVIGAERNITATCKSLFALEEDQSLAEDKRFSKLLKESGDLHTWINTGKIMNGLLSKGNTSMLNLSDFFKDNVTTVSVVFDNGKITADIKGYNNSKATAIAKEYFNGKIDEDMIRRIPGKEAAGVIALNFKPEAIREILKLANVDGMVNSGLGRFNLSMDDVIKAFKGDLILGATDLSVKIDTVYTYPDGSQPPVTVPKPDGNFIVAASVGDKAAFEKVFQVLQSNIGKATPAFEKDDHYVVFSNTKTVSDQYLSGNNKNNFDFISNISGGPSGLYLNIRSLMGAFHVYASKEDTLANTLYEANYALWKDLQYKSKGINNDISESILDINLMDDKTNSLNQLYQYGLKIRPILKQRTMGMQAALPPAADSATDKTDE